MKLAILQARTSSSRLPGKVLKPIMGRPMMAYHIERLQHAHALDKIVVATSVEDSDTPISELCQDIGVDCFRGSLENVLDRYYQAANEYEADHVIRVTADCPLADWGVIDQVVNKHLEDNYAFTSNTVERSHPDGHDVEAMPFHILEWAWENASTQEHKEHVTPYVLEQLENLHYAQVVQDIDMSDLRWTVDNPEDFEMVRCVYEGLYKSKPDFDTMDILKFLHENPDVRNLNADEVAKTKYDHLARLLFDGA